MNPQIKHRISVEVLFEGDAGMSVRNMLEKATKSGANLRDASFRQCVR